MHFQLLFELTNVQHVKRFDLKIFFDVSSVYKQVEEDGSFAILEKSARGGRYLMGLGSLLTGVKVG